jgi:hypothetical protein
MNGFVVGSDGVAHDYDDWADTEFGPQFQQQAWSDGEQPFEPRPYRERHRWVTTLAGAGIAVALGALITAIVLLTTGASSDSRPTTPDANGMTTATAAPPPWTSPVETPPPPPGPFVIPTIEAEHITKDGEFLQRILQMGYTFGNPAIGISNAHITCENLSNGFSRDRLAFWMWSTNDPATAGLALADVRKAVDAAADTYCPGLG